MRGIEISRLQLADIDWRQGTVVLKHTKSRRQDLMPLPVMTGRALEAYEVAFGDPQCLKMMVDWRS